MTLRIDIAFDGLNRIFRVVTVEFKPMLPCMKVQPKVSKIRIANMEGRPHQMQDSKRMKEEANKI